MNIHLILYLPNMRLLFILTSLFLYCPHSSMCQYFEGRLEYVTIFRSKKTQKLFAEIPTIETLKGAKRKTNVPHAEKGQLDWEIEDFSSGISYSRKSYKNTHQPDSPLVVPIIRTKTCISGNSANRKLVRMGTILKIQGFECNVIFEFADSIKMAEYYCCPAYRIDPAEYACNRTDDVDRIYRFTGGKLVVKWVITGGPHYIDYQLQKVHQETIDEKEFEIPKGIPIKDEVKH